MQINYINYNESKLIAEPSPSGRNIRMIDLAALRGVLLALISAMALHKSSSVAEFSNGGKSDVVGRLVSDVKYGCANNSSTVGRL